MSRSSGTGSPVWFRCAVARRERLGPLSDREHRVELTGRTRPYRPKHRSPLGPRSTRVAREYACSCGHVGWSNHIDLERLAGGLVTVFSLLPESAAYPANDRMSGSTPVRKESR